MTIYIYNYDGSTGEYLNKKVADADPEETKIRGEFIPLVPAYATLVEPPEVENGHVAVFVNGVWQDKLDYRNFFTVDENLNVTQITIMDKPEGIIINSDLAEKIKNNPENYKIENNKVVEKTEEDKKREHKEKIALLSLTKREVFLALYNSKQMTPEQIKSQIADPRALIEFDYANEYYRGNPLIDEIGKKLGYSADDLDYLFENKELPQ